MTSLAPMYYPVRHCLGEIVDESDILDRAAVAALIGVEPDTITAFLQASRPGGIYEKYPFPAPDFRLGGRPGWKASRAGEIRQWDETRPRGVGGRPRKNASN